MGIDGFSMSNLGMHRNLTSAQLSNEVEATAKQALENQIADVDGVGKREKAGRKDPDAAFNGMIPFIPDEEENKENEENQQEQSEQEQPQSSKEEPASNEDTKGQYHFKLNPEGMIEVWDEKTNNLLRTVSTEDAAKTFTNLSQAPGLFVNRKI